MAAVSVRGWLAYLDCAPTICIQDNFRLSPVSAELHAQVFEVDLLAVTAAEAVPLMRGPVISIGH